MGWFSDTWDTMRMMVDSSYVPVDLKKSVNIEGKTPEQVRAETAALSKESNEKTASIQTVAKNAETAMATAIEAPEVIAGAVASGGESLFWDASMGTFTEDIVNKIQEKRGEAPLRTLHALYSPLGDKHYQSGGSSDDHPDRPKTGTHETGIVGPVEQLAAVKDVAVDYKNDITELAKMLWHKATGDSPQTTPAEAAVDVPAAKIMNSRTAEILNATTKSQESPSSSSGSSKGSLDTIEDFLQSLLKTITKTVAGLLATPNSGVPNASVAVTGGVGTSESVSAPSGIPLSNTVVRGK